MNNGLSPVASSSKLSDSLDTFPSTPVKPAGFVGGTISSADVALQPMASTSAKAAANRLLRNCNFDLKGVFIFLFVLGKATDEVQEDPVT